MVDSETHGAGAAFVLLALAKAGLGASKARIIVSAVTVRPRSIEWLHISGSLSPAGSLVSSHDQHHCFDLAPPSCSLSPPRRPRREASVIDGDTIEIRGERVRLEGINAPESRQLCTIDGEPYRCGQQAALALADRIGERTVRCEGRTRDRYGRTIATCYVGDEDINAWMVAQGWALAFRRYSTGYVAEEEAARAAASVPATCRRSGWQRRKLDRITFIADALTIPD